VIAIAFCAIASATLAQAQETINQTTISGCALDSQGAAVPRACLKAAGSA
jgi:hypothetical protein